MSDLDVEFAERIVSGLLSASGSQQFLNKLDVIELELYRRAKSAQGLMERKGTTSSKQSKDLKDMTFDELIQQLNQPQS